MVFIPKLISLMFLFFITITEGGKKSVEKIVIHVPYKIHKHHHTHTKYKVIALPTPKKENTVIYLKEEIQPIIKHVTPVQIKTEVLPTAIKTPQTFIPPHQESAASLLNSVAVHKEQNEVQTLESQQYSTILDDQKPLESSQVGQTTEELVPSFSYKPIILPSPNVISDYSLKPLILQPQHTFTPKLVVNEGFFPKFSYRPMAHLPPSHFRPKYMIKQAPPKKVAQDNVAHSSSHVYKTVMSPKYKAKPYKVKEESKEGGSHFMKHQKTTSNAVSVPSLKSGRKGKMSFNPGQNFQFKNIENMIPPNNEYEYEHVGYLIIDGDSRKVVGKNFKDPIHLSR